MLTQIALKIAFPNIAIPATTALLDLELFLSMAENNCSTQRFTDAFVSGEFHAPCEKIFTEQPGNPQSSHGSHATESESEFFNQTFKHAPLPPNNKLTQLEIVRIVIQKSHNNKSMPKSLRLRQAKLLFIKYPKFSAQDFFDRHLKEQREPQTPPPTIDDLKKLNFSPKEVLYILPNTSAAALYEAKYTLKELHDSEHELYNIFGDPYQRVNYEYENNMADKDPRKAQKVISDLREAGFTASNITSVFPVVSARQLNIGGFTIKQILGSRSIAKSLQYLRMEGFTLKQLLDAGLSPSLKELKEATFTIEQLLDAGLSPH